MNARLHSHALASGKEVRACLKDFAKGKVARIATCVDADRKGKLARVAAKTAAVEARKCTGTDKRGQPLRPDRLFGGARAVEEAGRTAGVGLVDVLFGGGAPEDAALTKESDAAGAKCQANVAARLLACELAVLKEFLKCKKAALKTGKEPFAAGATTAAEIATCAFADPRGKVAKACDLGTAGEKKVDGLRKALGKCVKKGAALGTVFPHCASSDVDAVHACLQMPVTCHTCRTLNQADGLALECDVVDDGDPNGSCDPGTPFVPEELAVKFDAAALDPNPVAARAEIDVLLAALGTEPILSTADVKDALGLGAMPAGGEAFDHLYWLRIVDGETVTSKIAAFEAEPIVESAEPNYRVVSAVRQRTPTDLRAAQWHHVNAGQVVGDFAVPGNRAPGVIDADLDTPQAWDLITDCRDVTVAVIDTGVDLDHRDLQANLVPGYDFTSDDMAGSPDDVDGHGTASAGVIGAVGNNSLGVTGICWQASVMPMRALSDVSGLQVKGRGATPMDLAIRTAAVLKLAGQANVGVINGSYGFQYASAVGRAVLDFAAAADILLVFAAGNEGIDNDVGEYIYRDVNGTRIIDPGDVRLGPVRAAGVLYPAGSVVLAGDRDVGRWPLARFEPAESYRDGNGNERYDPGEAIYANFFFETWRRTDVAPDRPAGSRIARGDPDRGFDGRRRFSSDEMHTSGTDSAGLDGFTNGGYPCRYPLDHILCVAASTPGDRLADFSSSESSPSTWRRRVCDSRCSRSTRLVGLRSPSAEKTRCPRAT